MKAIVLNILFCLSIIGYSQTNSIVTENYLRLNFTPKGGVTPGTENTLAMDCDQILARYNVSISGVTTTGTRLPSQNQLTSTACSLPSFISASCGNATYSTIEASATINSDGGCTVTSRGIQYSTDASFTTINGSVTAPSGGIGQYYLTITGLTCGTTYYFRPWATNSVGTYYANSLIGSGCTTQTNNYSNIVLNNAITVSNCGFVGDFTASLTNAQTACQDFKDWADGLCTINGWTGFTVKAESLTVGKQTYVYNSCSLRTDTGYYLYSPNTASRSIVYLLNGVIQSITACP